MKSYLLSIHVIIRINLFMMHIKISTIAITVVIIVIIGRLV